MIATSALTSPPGPGELKYSGASAFEKWHLVASATRKAWDPTEALPASRFDSRDVLGGEKTRASLAFDWQRSLDTGGLEAAVFAKRTALDLFSDVPRLDGSPMGERFEQRDRRSLIGAAVRWSGDGSLGPLDAAHLASARLTTQTYDGDGGFRMPGGEATGMLRQDRLRQAGATFDFGSEVQLMERLRASANLRYDSYRFGVASDLDGHDGSRAGTLASPRISLVADLSAASSLFVNAGRGYGADDARTPGAAIDPRNGAPIGRLDPLATVATTEAGWRARLAPRAEATVSVFRSRVASQLLLTGDTGASEAMRPSVRQGVTFAARYEPLSWIALDLQASALHARHADGSRVAGAPEHTVTGAMTLRTPDGWTASLLVNSLGEREAEGESPRVKPSTFVNGRLTRNLTKTTRVTLDVFNVFDRRADNLDYFSAARLWNAPGAADSFLFNPAEPRGFRVKMRTTFQ
jgi:hypothetical protein